MKNKEIGITLIALIITIIVMLILVAVTINVALNGGIFEKAKTAQEQTQKETIKEEAEVAKATAYAEAIKNNTTFGVSDAVEAIAQELEGTAKETYVEIATKSGSFYVVVDNELKVTITENKPEAVDDLIPTSDQLNDADLQGVDNKQYTFSNDLRLVYLDGDGAKEIEFTHNETLYMWLCDKASETIFQEFMPGIKANKWYSIDMSNPENRPQIYTGTYPVILDSLLNTPANAHGYIDRIIDSF